MIVFLYIWVIFIIICGLFFLADRFIEKKFDENHPVMKWWRKNVVAILEKEEI